MNVIVFYNNILLTDDQPLNLLLIMEGKISKILVMQVCQRDVVEPSLNKRNPLPCREGVRGWGIA